MVISVQSMYSWQILNLNVFISNIKTILCDANVTKHLEQSIDYSP